MFEERFVSPPSWPDGVEAPGAPGWEESAQAWLFDQVPLSWRAYGVFQRQPVLLARAARQLFSAAQEGGHGFGGSGPFDAARARQLVGELGLVEDALAGVRWIAPIASS